jgi:hypothetical protein
MKSACIVALALTLGAAALHAERLPQAPLAREALASILGQAAPAGACGAAQGWAPANALPPARTSSTCMVTATCSTGTVSCSGNSTCYKQDSGCKNGIQGFVNCDGVVTWCPQCPCGSLWCCQCELSGDCLDCCRCAGGTFGGCLASCGG